MWTVFQQCFYLAAIILKMIHQRAFRDGQPWSVLSGISRHGTLRSALGLPKEPKFD